MQKLQDFLTILAAINWLFKIVINLKILEDSQEYAYSEVWSYLFIKLLNVKLLMSNFSIFSCYFIVLHTLNFLSPMLSFINNNNFSFFGFSSLSFFVFVFTTLKKKYLFLKIVSIDLILFQVKALYYHRKCFGTTKSV